MSLNLRRALSLLLLTGAVSSTACGPLAAQAPVAVPQSDRVAAQPDLHATTRLAGHVPAWATTANDAGPASTDTGLTLTFLLTRSAARQAAFEQMLADQQTPGSPSYHRWLTPQQIGTLYGPTQHDLAAFTTWLTAQGFAVTGTAPSGIFVTAQAPVSTVANALATSFRLFQLTGPDGKPEARPRLAATAEPSIPTSFAALVGSISGLADIPVYPMHAKRIAAMPASDGEIPAATSTGGVHLLTPNDFAVIYDLNPIYKAGFTGVTQRVAIIGRSRVLASDISSYETLVALPAIQPTVLIPPTGTDPGITNTPDQDEATLDVDRIIGTAPGAGVDLIVTSAGTGGLSAIQLAAQYEVNTVRDPIMNISFSACEANSGATVASFWDNLFAVAAGEGISSFVSSGDSGAAACQTAAKPPTGVQARGINVICASSYATCVGGTEFADFAAPATYWSTANGTGLESATSFIPEGAWNEPTGSGTTPFVLTGTGGGVSTFIPKPTWQTGTGVPADGFRDVPDVSFSASSHDGYLACLAYSGGDCVKSITIFSGTSASTPGMAGIAALLNQKQGGPQGNINPLLYSIASTTQAAFHDATPASSGVVACDLNTASMCNNSTPSATALTGGLAGFALTPGYDQATGLGSLDASAFLTAASALPTLSLTAASASLTLTAGATTGNTDALTLASTNFSGAVTLTCAITYNGTGTPSATPTCSVNPSTVTLAANGSAASTLTIATTQPHLAAAQASSLASRPGTHPSVQAGSSLLVRVTLSSLVCFAFLPWRRRFASLRALRCLQTLSLALLLLGGLTTLSACSGSSTPVAGNPLLISATTTTLVAAQTTVPAGTTDSFTASVVNSGFNTTVTPTGTVQFVFNGNTPVGSAPLVAGKATSPAGILFATAGTYAVSANYSGDSNFSASSSGGVPITVTPVGITTGAYTVTLTATAASGLTATRNIALTIQ